MKFLILTTLIKQILAVCTVSCYCPTVRMDYDRCYIETSDARSLNTDIFIVTLCHDNPNLMFTL